MLDNTSDGGSSIALQNGRAAAGQSSCRKCGECCKQGGPALHSSDLKLIKSGKIAIDRLITIRKGELAHNPVSGKIQPVSVELVKIIGTGSSWECCFYNGHRGCTVYDRRPHACRILKCWDTDAILGLVEKDTLSRFDILPENEPLVPVIQEHEKICPYDDLGQVQSNIGRLADEHKKDLEKRVRNDLLFRSKVIKEFKLKLSDELFYFGRPLFQILQPLGVKVLETKEGLQIKWAG